MLLKELLHNVSVITEKGDDSIIIQEVCFDSRKAKEDTLFVAVRGSSSDGHFYIDQAIKLGAKAIICEEFPEKLSPEITYIQVENSADTLAKIASNWYDNPSRKLKLIGVTGTNGKTTITSLLYQLAKKMGYVAGLISTVEIRIDDKTLPTTHTTPDILTTHQVLSQMVKAGVEYVFMEVSSHGIAQKRIEGLHFTGGVFTNLTHDHLDYHKTFVEYRDTKKLFFDTLPKKAFALTNADDKNGKIMLQNTKATPKTYALKTFADYKAQILENQMEGLVLRINGMDLWTRLIGEFNAYNLLAIFGTASLLGWDEMQVLQNISILKSVNGRFQHSVSESGVITIIDYAHTPDALKNVLETINNIRTKNEKLITIVGCGGNRDKTKRPKMANIASILSDGVILTSDNPRNEEPNTIIEDMEAGISPEYLSKVTQITDRRQAIQTACKTAQKGDIILVAGKGHETYQEIKGVKIHFDDHEIVNEFLKRYHK